MMQTGKVTDIEGTIYHLILIKLEEPSMAVLTVKESIEQERGS